MDTSLESAFPGQQLYNKIDILNNGLCHFSHSPTSLHLFSHLSLTRKNIIGIPFLTSTRVSYKNTKTYVLVEWPRSLSTVTGRFSDLSPIQNNIAMEHHWNPLSSICTLKIIKKQKHKFQIWNSFNTVRHSLWDSRTLSTLPSPGSKHPPLYNLYTCKKNMCCARTTSVIVP
jgi:hypothetical protein